MSSGKPFAIRDEKSIMAAWERFLSGERAPENVVHRVVADSWRRCLERGVDPGRRTASLTVDDEGLHSVRGRDPDLIEAAKPVMEQARELLAQTSTMMVLTDPTGVVLWVEGDPDTIDNGQDIKLMPGAVWSESVIGTNAIGTALSSGQAVQILSAEHFCEGLKQWACSASVIRDTTNGKVIGVLDISGLSASHSPHCLALATTAVGRIEARLAALDAERRAHLLDATLNQIKRREDRGLVILDTRGRVVQANESARLFFGRTGLDMADCTQLWAEKAEDGAPAPSLPKWLRADWVEPITEKNRRLGTALSIPLSRDWTPTGAVQMLVHKEPFLRILGTSALIAKVKARARQLARLHVPVLLTGPTGVGKELFARSLHDAGPTASGPFVPLNCGTATRDLLTSELFGYASGAFTGARRGGAVGKFEAADGGTLFLDEIGELPLETQAHFLRVLEDGEVYRLGETRPRKVRVRVVAATNRDLLAEVASGNFRKDLFYRLAVTTLSLPALAEHPEDIPVLVHHFADDAARRHGVPVKYPIPNVLKVLVAYSWPGNVRELRNVVEGMVLLAEGDALTLDDLPNEVNQSAAATTRERAGSPEWAEATAGRLRDSERNAIVSAMHAERGNLTRTAFRLGIAKSTLYEKMKRLGINRASATTIKPS